MLYKHSKTGKMYKGVDKAFVVISKGGRVTIKIGKTDHTYNYINLDAFEHCLEELQVPHFKASYEHIAQAFLDRELT